MSSDFNCFLKFIDFSTISVILFIFFGDFLSVMRIDKYLKVTRLLKRRSTAKEAASGNRVKVNGKVVKPSHEVKIGDIIEIGFNSGAVSVLVLDIKETVKKEQVESLYKIL